MQTLKSVLYREGCVVGDVELILYAPENTTTNCTAESLTSVVKLQLDNSQSGIVYNISGTYFQEGYYSHFTPVLFLFLHILSS